MKRALIITACRPGNGAPEESIPGRSGEVMKIARIRTQSAWTRQKLGLTNRTAGRKTIYYPWPGSRDSAADLVVLQDPTAEPAAGLSSPKSALQADCGIWRLTGGAV